MRAYQTYRFHQWPDQMDLYEDARKSSIGSIGEHGSIRNARQKAAIRRRLKRADRAKSLRLELEAEENL